MERSKRFAKSMLKWLYAAIFRVVPYNQVQKGYKIRYDPRYHAQGITKWSKEQKGDISVSLAHCRHGRETATNDATHWTRHFICSASAACLLFFCIHPTRAIMRLPCVVAAMLCTKAFSFSTLSRTIPIRTTFSSTQLSVATTRDADFVEQLVGGERYEMVPLPDSMLSTTLFVGNLCEFVTDDKLSRVFSVVSSMISVPACVARKPNASSMQYGFVTFPTVEEKEVSSIFELFCIITLMKCASLMFTLLTLTLTNKQTTGCNSSLSWNSTTRTNNQGRRDSRFKQAQTSSSPR